ncbi:unnamed protein product [Trichogramma brassicae]|uniref:Uncharacterized protein n=1 Tax=Trichogramma brassicae TaxID=86971 RepID=A0A6H5IVY0_9HYME|nr:unnamed protein product [Trichogramma brassicae]
MIFNEQFNLVSAGTIHDYRHSGSIFTREYLDISPCVQLSKYVNQATGKRNVQVDWYEASDDVSIKKPASSPSACGPPCYCRLKCQEKLKSRRRARIRRTFLKLGAKQRLQYVALCVIETPKRRSRPRLQPLGSERRQKTLTYILQDGERGRAQRVCKAMFLSTLGVSEKFVRGVVARRRTSGLGVLVNNSASSSSSSASSSSSSSSSRGRKSEAVREHVREHIRSFEAETMPGDVSGKRYLDVRLNCTSMYKMYLQCCETRGLPRAYNVGLNYYRELFKSEFNLDFKSRLPKQ